MPKLRDQYHGGMGTDSLSPACIYFSLDQSRFTFAFTIMKPLHSSIALADSRYMCVSSYHSLFFTYWTVPLCSWIRLFTLPLPFADYKEKMCVCGLQHWALPSQVISPIYNTVNLYLEYAMAVPAKNDLVLPLVIHMSAWKLVSICWNLFSFFFCEMLCWNKCSFEVYFFLVFQLCSKFRFVQIVQLDNIHVFLPFPSSLLNWKFYLSL